jgi:hypothetical protein
LTPFQANLDPTSKEGMLQWQYATKPPHNWKPLADTVENHSLFVDALKDLAMKMNMIIFKIPTQGDRTIRSTVRTIASRNRPNYNLSSYVNILDDHNTKLKNQESIKYSHWFFGNDTASFDLSTAGADLIAHAIDPNKTGNLGLAYQYMLRLRRESIMLFQLLVNLVDPISSKHIVFAPKSTPTL